METSAATPTRPPHQAATSPSPSPSSSLRLWRPAAQRNMRNQWSHLSAAKEQWLAAVADGRAHASALVNVHLSCRNMPAMDLGVLKDMPGIRDKANSKLALREEQYSGMLLSAYKEMRLLLLEFLSIALKEGVELQTSLNWGDELYDGESNKLQSIGLQSGDAYSPPENWCAERLGSQRPGNLPLHEVLQVYLTTWHANMNINRSRIGEIFELVEEEMKIKLS
ncbi:Stellacyanin [Zea mays]|uniref:Stellacyanin n=1 Tax=Zea mays TaxID=4577 RepID=A0A1D6PHG9_MAIZE|nr:Stellacyanin [Zea mays]